MNLVFVHGWGCNAAVWEKLVPFFDDHEVHLIDLGFVRGGPRGANAFPENALCIGHSFGVMWLLKHGVRPMRGLVSIAGFDCLHKYVPHDVLAEMREGMRRDARAQMEQFWQSIGMSEETADWDIDAGGLRGGLDWIATWDTGDQLEDLGAPVLALAAENDRVVRKDATQSIWGSGSAELHWHPNGGHMLQLSEPEWCATHIRTFADGLEP
ncbi:MAG: alpha/beta fold hydrolase [Hyphomicrobiaceae bacterium]|nr:alpha/beta fold hydrolase [Hyphomicrobiaceae bacterium]